jgi:hypothetical protein
MIGKQEKYFFNRYYSLLSTEKDPGLISCLNLNSSERNIFKGVINALKKYDKVAEKTNPDYWIERMDNLLTLLKKEGLVGITFFSDADKIESKKTRNLLARTFVYIKEMERSGEILPY